MTTLYRRLAGEARDQWPVISVDQYATWLQQAGFGGAGLNQSISGAKEEVPDGSFRSYAWLYKSNGIVFACMRARMDLFTEARFQYQRLRRGRPADMYGDASLSILEKPWTNGTTGDLIARILQDSDLGGNSYTYRKPGGNRLVRLVPDWVTIVLGGESDPQDGWDDDAEIAGYLYHPGGMASGRPVKVFLPDEVAHVAPIPDPVFQFRGMSWLTPIVREVLGDNAATNHKLKFFENGATPNMVVSLDPSVKQAAFKEWVDEFEKRTKGTRNAYRTLYLGAGSKVEVVGTSLKEMDFKLTQGAGETRIAAAAGTPPVVVGLSEGLQSATYSNYGQARRRMADMTARPWWRNVAGSLETIVPPPPGVRLWYDTRDVAALQDDVKDRAEVQSLRAQSIKALVDAGFTADSVVLAIDSEDLTLLKHTGLFSVQLLPPGGTGTDPNAPAPDAGAPDVKPTTTDPTATTTDPKATSKSQES